MICILAGNLLEAQRWAEGQLLEQNEWFYPKDEGDILFRSNFHTLVVGTAGQNVSPKYFERILSLAKQRGKIGR